MAANAQKQAEDLVNGRVQSSGRGCGAAAELTASRLPVNNGYTSSEVPNGRVSMPLAVVTSAVFLVGGTALAVDRLRSFTLAGETT